MLCAMRYSRELSASFIKPPTPVLWIKNQQAGSTYEYNFSVALDFYEIPYLYQVSYWGGRSMAGGMVLDFLVFSGATPTAVWINGGYWHKGSRKDIDFLQQAMIINLFRGRVNVLTLYGEDTSTLDLAKNSVRRYIL